MSQVNVFVEVCREGIELPQYAKHGDSGMDVRAAETIELDPHETKVIPTGLKVAIPLGYEIQIRPRSGLSLKTDLRVSNSPGTIDTGFRDEVGIIITNTGKNYEVINKGDRIAQMVLSQVPTIQWVELDNVGSIGQNRGGGFGSTGK